jgi:hypothetical protein
MASNRWASLWQDRRTLWLLLITLAAVALVGLGILLDYQRIVTDTTIEADQRATQLAAARIRDELAQFPDALTELARSAAIISQDPELQSQALQQAAPIQEGLFDAGIVVLNNFGVVTAAEPARPELLQQDWSGRSYFRELINGSASSVVFSNAMSDGPSGAPVIVVSVPVIDGEGRFAGALAGMLRLSQTTISPFYATLVRLRVSPEGAVYLLDRSGRILFDTASLLDGEQYLNHRLPVAGDAPPVRTGDAAGRQLLVTHAVIPGAPWYLVVEKDWESLAAPTRTHVALLLALLGLGALLPLLGLALLLRPGQSAWGRRGQIAHDSLAGRQIEQALLTEHMPVLPGWEITAHCEPAPAAGRVFYDALLGVDGCLTVILAEANRPDSAGGDSVEEVLSMVAVRSLLRSAARSLLSPAAALEHTNRQLAPELPPGHIVACLYCRLNPTNGAITIGNADGVRPLQVAGGAVATIGGRDAALAVQLDSRYGEYAALLAEGDQLFLCNSEVLNAQNAKGETFGLSRLQRALSAAAEPDVTTGGEAGAQRIAAVTNALREFAGGKWANDRDAILIVLERLPSSASLAPR